MLPGHSTCFPTTPSGTPPQPLNAYAAVKARCEQIVTASPLASCVLRLATVHGHPAAGELKQSVHRLLHQAAQGAVHIYAPTNWRPFIQREEAARAIDRAIRRPHLTGIYNLANDHATFGMVAGYAAGLFGAQLHIDHSRADPRSYRVTSDKALCAGLLSPEPPQDLWTSMSGYAARLREPRSQD
ncbi:MAG: NAD-dependent epimerase/dehydratase family protein [Pseudonocardiaceae bacterium]